MSTFEPTQTGQKMSLLDLPSELRIEIYKHCLLTPDVIYLKTDAENKIISFVGYARTSTEITANLLATCKTVQAEAYHYLYSNKLRFVDIPTAELFLKRASARSLGLLRAIHIQRIDPDGLRWLGDSFNPKRRLNRKESLKSVFNLLCSATKLEKLELSLFGECQSLIDDDYEEKCFEEGMDWVNWPHCISEWLSDYGESWFRAVAERQNCARAGLDIIEVKSWVADGAHSKEFKEHMEEELVFLAEDQGWKVDSPSQ